MKDGYEIAVKELVNAKVNNLPIPKDELPAARPSNVVNLMDALRKSLGAPATSLRKPVASVKEPVLKGVGLVKDPVKKARKTA